jgi:NTP pyrophosphatase (non-canonical NTP hydrolase)
MSEAKSIREMINEIRQFCVARDWDRHHNVKDLAIGVSTEANELLENFRFYTTEESERLFETPEAREAIEDEIVDTLYFLLRIVDRYNVDLTQAFDRKMRKNEIKYPARRIVQTTN